MKRNNIKNKRIRFGRAFSAVLAAAVAAFGFGSCAALEMLDKLAAEEENANHSASVTEASVPSAVNPDTEDEKPAADTSSAKGDAETSSAEAGVPAPTGEGENADKNEGNTSSAGAMDYIESMLVPEPPAGGVSSPDSLAGSDTSVNEPGQQQISTDSSLFTDLADSGSAQEGSGDIYTPGNFSPELGNDSSALDPYSPVQTGGSQIYLAYSELVDKYASYVAKDPTFKPEYCRYYITDIDDNGIAEILIETGTIETDRTIYVYTFDGRDAELLGNFVAWHTRLGDGAGVIYTETSAMGSYIVGTIRIQDGKLFSQREEQPFSESQITMPIIGYPYTNTAPLETLKN